MKRKGFTLIELLAVIVILAIIALIAVPMVLDVIEQARRGAFEQSLNNVAKAVELYQAREELHDSLTECRYFSFGNDVEEVTQRDNKTYYPIKDLDIKGSLPTEGEIEICPTNIAIEASNGSYTGRYDGDKTNVVKGDLASTDIEEPIIDIFNTTSTIDQIIVTTSAHSASEYGTIEYYYYKLNDGDYIKTTSKSYLFTNLEAGTEYTVYVKVENKSGITSEKSKTVVTKSFGDINIDVEKVGEWTNSKTVMLTGDTDGYALEYRIRRYNEKTGLEEESDYTEYTEPIVLNSVATEEHPIIIIVRYRNGNITSDEKSLSITKIDTTAPTSTSPAVTVSTTKPTSELNVIIRQADAESGFNNSTIEYGYSTSQGGTYTWQSNSTLTGLNAGTTYYIKTRVTNNVGMTTESEVNSYTMGSISTCSVTPSSSGWMASKTATITGSQTGTQLQYQIGSTLENGWINITSGGETPAITSNTIVYCRLFDGTSAGTHGQGAITKIDITAPTVEIGNVSATPTSITIPFTATDTESGIKETKCMYAQSQDYLGFGSMPPYYAGTVTASGNTCIINGLRANSTYYYKVVTTNNAGISAEKLGQTKTYSLYSNGTIIYFNPVTGKKCTDYTASNSNTGTKTGCMKWYAFNDDGSDTVDLILDHNTTATVSWATSDNVIADVVHPTLRSTTASWTGVPARSDSYSDSMGGYTLNYNGARARLLTYEDLKEAGMDYGVTPSDCMFFLDRVGTSCVSNGTACSNNADDSSVVGYWTASTSSVFEGADMVWTILDVDRLVDIDTSYDTYLPGIRPVITVSRSVLQ